VAAGLLLELLVVLGLEMVAAIAIERTHGASFRRRFGTMPEAHRLNLAWLPPRALG
jgi:hypothetical protein